MTGTQYNLSIEYRYHRYKTPNENSLDYFGKIQDDPTDYQTGYYVLDTTLVDKHGHKVYEGDIIRWTGSLYIILWNRFAMGYRAFEYKPNTPSRDCELMWCLSIDSSGYIIEVLGDIFTNADLLGATTDTLIAAIRYKDRRWN